MESKLVRYNIRVYGLWINELEQVLVTDEYRMGVKMTKFPGGGHELGEGLADAVAREWSEELSVEVSVGKLFYINDFLQVSAFSKHEQILSVYYLVKPLTYPDVHYAQNRFDFAEEVDGAQTFRWISLSEISQDDFTFPIDKVVAEKLANRQFPA